MKTTTVEKRRIPFGGLKLERLVPGEDHDQVSKVSKQRIPFGGLKRVDKHLQPIEHVSVVG